MREGRDAFVKAATAAGLTKEEAKALATELGLVPKDVAILVKQTGGAEAASGCHQRCRRRPDLHDLGSLLVPRFLHLSSIPRHGRGRWNGGAIHGPGSGTSDTAGLFRLSNWEHVLTAAEGVEPGGQGAVYALRAAVRQGNSPGLAGWPTHAAVRTQDAGRVRAWRGASARSVRNEAATRRTSPSSPKTRGRSSAPVEDGSLPVEGEPLAVAHECQFPDRGAAQVGTLTEIIDFTTR